MAWPPPWLRAVGQRAAHRRWRLRSPRRSAPDWVVRARRPLLPVPAEQSGPAATDPPRPSVPAWQSLCPGEESSAPYRPAPSAAAGRKRQPAVSPGQERPMPPVARGVRLRPTGSPRPLVLRVAAAEQAAAPCRDRKDPAKRSAKTDRPAARQPPDAAHSSDRRSGRWRCARVPPCPAAAESAEPWQGWDRARFVRAAPDAAARSPPLPRYGTSSPDSSRRSRTAAPEWSAHRPAPSMP